MTDKRLGVLVATINEKLERVVRKILPQLSKCDVVISHQVTDGKVYDPVSFEGGHVLYSQTQSAGLSRNRNNALTHATSEINLITDDDVEYVPDFEQRVLSEYESHHDADIITFRVERGHHVPEKREDHFTHNKWSLRKVPSVGITFKKSSLKKTNVRFDERFGLGAVYESGEEQIFLKDCLDAGLKLVHVEVPIVRHTHLSSAWIWNKAQVRAKVAVMWRMYGPLVAFVIPLRFVFTKKELYQEHMSPLGYLVASYGSWFRVLTHGL